MTGQLEGRVAVVVGAGHGIQTEMPLPALGETP
jgi:hypothetical protein